MVPSCTAHTSAIVCTSFSSRSKRFLTTEDVVKNRFDRLLKEVHTIAAEVCAVHEGTIQTALIESVSEHDPSMVTGRLSNNLLVHIKGDKGMIGRLADVRLTECKGFYYLGELAE